MNVDTEIFRSTPASNFAGRATAAGTVTNSDRARAAAVAFEGMLLQQCLAPLAKPMGFYGDLVLGACTHAVAERSNGGLSRMLASLIERARPDGGPAS